MKVRIKIEMHPETKIDLEALEKETETKFEDVRLTKYGVNFTIDFNLMSIYLFYILMHRMLKGEMISKISMENK